MLLHKIKATHRNISAWYQCWYFFISAKQERTALVQWSRSSYPRDEWREVIRLFLLFLWSQWPEPQKVKMAAFLRAMNYGPRAELDLDWETLVHRGITVQLRAPHRQCVLALLRPTHPWPAPLAHTGPGSPTAFSGFICSLTSLIHHTAHSQPLLSLPVLFTPQFLLPPFRSCSINADVPWVSVLGPPRVISPIPLVSVASSMLIICSPDIQIPAAF